MFILIFVIVYILNVILIRLRNILNRKRGYTYEVYYTSLYMALGLSLGFIFTTFSILLITICDQYERKLIKFFEFIMNIPYKIDKLNKWFMYDIEWRYIK